MIKRRRRFKQTTTLQQRLTAFARETRERASGLSAGPERQDLLRRADRADNTARLDEYLSSVGLQSPK